MISEIRKYDSLQQESFVRQWNSFFVELKSVQCRIKAMFWNEDRGTISVMAHLEPLWITHHDAYIAPLLETGIATLNKTTPAGDNFTRFFYLKLHLCEQRRWRCIESYIFKCLGAMVYDHDVKSCAALCSRYHFPQCSICDSYSSRESMRFCFEMCPDSQVYCLDCAALWHVDGVCHWCLGRGHIMTENLDDVEKSQTVIRCLLQCLVPSLAKVLLQMVAEYAMHYRF